MYNFELSFLHSGRMSGGILSRSSSDKLPPGCACDIGWYSETFLSLPLQYAIYITCATQSLQEN